MKSLFVLSLLLFNSTLFADVAQQVKVEKSFARAAIIQQRNSAAFMSITNQGEPSAIVYATSPVAKIVELHTHINDNGVMRMRKIKQIDLPAGKQVMLKPGGLHVMMLGLKQDLKPGDQIDVTLGFADGSEIPLQIPVQKMTMKRPMKGHRNDGRLPAIIKH